MTQQIPSPPHQMKRSFSRKWIAIAIITIILITFHAVVIFIFLSPRGQVAGHYETGNLLASSQPQTTGQFTMSSDWLLDWWYPVVTGNESLSTQEESKLVIVICDANTRQPIQTVVGYVNVDPQYETLAIKGTFYLSITSPHATADHTWYFRITCSTLAK